MSVDNIRENNIAINSMIKKLIESKRKDQNYKGFQIINADGKKDIDPDIKKILECEFKKCLLIYEMEFGKEFKGCKDVSIFTKDGVFPDCSGGVDGLRIADNLQSDRMKFMFNMIKRLKEHININEENIVSFVQGKGNYDEERDYKDLKILDSDKYVGSTKDQFDYSMYLFATGAIDLDFVMDVIAHEAMHTFGVVGGINFFKEGMTEELTREMGDKYGLHMTATAHTQETEFMRKLELLVGRDLVVDAAMYNYKLDSWRDEELGNLLNNKDLGLENIELKELQKIFKLARYDEEKLKKPEYEKDLNDLNKFETNHKAAFEKIKEIIKRYNDKSESVKYTENGGYDKNTRYGEIAEAFDKQIGKEGAFKQYAIVLDNMYGIAMDFKNDPVFLRELYTKTWEELLEDINTKKEILENSKVQEKDNDKLIKIYEDTIKSLNEISKTCKSYDDLMAPINEKIKNKNLEIKNPELNADLEKKIIEIQEEERKLLREKFKITEEPQEVKTNTEISLGEKSEVSLQKASDTVKKSENVEIQDLVNSSRNNSNVVLGIIDERMEKNAKNNKEISDEKKISEDSLRI